MIVRLKQKKNQKTRTRTVRSIVATNKDRTVLRKRCCLCLLLLLLYVLFVKCFFLFCRATRSHNDLLVSCLFLSWSPITTLTFSSSFLNSCTSASSSSSYITPCLEVWVSICRVLLPGNGGGNNCICVSKKCWENVYVCGSVSCLSINFVCLLHCSFQLLL